MKITMITEGTYPHGFGGVSVWCDQLVRGMPEHEFSLVAIAASAADQVVWSLPRNVTSLSTIALWGGSAARRTPGARNALPRRLSGGLIDSLLDTSAGAQGRFSDVLRELFEFGQRGNRGVVLATAATVRLLSDAWADTWPTPADSVPSTHDAVTALHLLDHFLRPLSHPPARGDVAHSVANGLGVLPALAAKWRYDTPVMVTEHGVYLREQYLQNRDSPYRWPVKALHLAFMRRLCTLGYHAATAITPGNVYNRRWEELLGADPARIRTVYNGVDPAHFPALEGEPDIPTISWLGRVDPIKDLETLLRAFAIVVRELPAARLRLFGSPPAGREAYLQRCQALAASLGIEKAVTFEGRVGNVRDAYAAGSIVVLSSVSEGFPYSLIEAMTCGRACVATNVGGVTEAVGETGIVVPPRSPAPMAQACLSLLRDNGLRHRLAAAARVRALENFTVDAAISAFDEIYGFLGRGRPLPVAAVPAPAVAMPEEPPGPWPRPNLVPSLGSSSGTA
jgi:glycosyltransferase involved in cell wall biosynthesis